MLGCEVTDPTLPERLDDAARHIGILIPKRYGDLMAEAATALRQLEQERDWWKETSLQQYEAGVVREATLRSRLTELEGALRECGGIREQDGEWHLDDCYAGYESQSGSRFACQDNCAAARAALSPKSAE